MTPPTSTLIAPPGVRIRPSIVLLGDSITQHAFGVEEAPLGWGSLLASTFIRRADVLNRGFSGYNTDMCVQRLLPTIFPKATSTVTMTTSTTTTTNGSSSSSNGIANGHAATATATAPTLPPSNVLFATVFFGANDAALPGGSQHVPLERFQENLRIIVRHIRAATTMTTEPPQPEQSSKVLPIIFITPPPFDATMWMNFQQITEPGRDNIVAREYGAAAQDVASEFQRVYCVDAWQLMKGDSDTDRLPYLSDGLHLSNKGNQVVFDGIMSVLQEKCPELLPMQDGDGRYGEDGGIPMEEDLWDRILGEV